MKEHLMARPFPKPGPLVELAYRDLYTAATGTDAQIRALGDLNALPRPWDPPTCPTEARAEVWAWLEDVAHWHNTEYCWDPDDLIPACWPDHPHLVHDLAVLADQRRTAGQALAADLLEEWHRYSLPYFHDRLRNRIRAHCDDQHQHWPAQARHASFNGATTDRDRRYGDDLMAGG